jgi:hypothetical protein
LGSFILLPESGDELDGALNPLFQTGQRICFFCASGCCHTLLNRSACVASLLDQ